MGSAGEEGRLARRLTFGDAVVIGLGSMIGAGVFGVLAPAAAAAGSGLLLGLAIAAVVAYCNATSSAQLAAVYPESGGTYVYGRERLGDMWGYLAGWGFVVGKSASCAAMALTIGAYASTRWQRPVALGAVLTLMAVNYFGVRKTAALTRVIVVVVLLVLAGAVAAMTFGGTVSAANVDGLGTHGLAGVLESAGLLFCAFAGYARIATLGEEVVDPARTIPRAIRVALGITLAVYAAVAVAALAAVGPATLARAAAPLAAAVDGGRYDALVPLIRVGAVVAATGVLLSLIVGVSRTTFAMAATGDLPRWLDAVHPVHKVPYRAEVAVGAAVAVLVALVDLRNAVGFSSFCVLTYYAIANASAWTLDRQQRTRPRALSALGLAGCSVIAVMLPWQSVVAGAGVFAVGIVVRGLQSLARHRDAGRGRGNTKGQGHPDVGDG